MALLSGWDLLRAADPRLWNLKQKTPSLTKGWYKYDTTDRWLYFSILSKWSKQVNMQYLLSCALHGQQYTHRSFTLTCLGYALNLAVFESDQWLPPQHLGWNWDPPQHWVDHQWREGYTEGHTATAWTTVYLEEMWFTCIYTVSLHMKITNKYNHNTVTIHYLCIPK